MVDVIVMLTHKENHNYLELYQKHNQQICHSCEVYQQDSFHSFYIRLIRFRVTIKVKVSGCELSLFSPHFLVYITQL